eukprot:m51a1_g11457 hypothetical protein (77) ;mRNA; f:6727-13525
MPVIIIHNEEQRWYGNYIPLNKFMVKKKMGSLKVWDVVQHCMGNKWLSKWDMKCGIRSRATLVLHADLLCHLESTC